jgi:translation initiation factor 1
MRAIDMPLTISQMATSKIVWTSDPEEAKRLRESGRMEPQRDAPPGTQTIRVALDRKRRAGKTVTVASGFSHSAETLARIATQLKKRCGSGGTAKENEIEIQGDHAETIAAELGKLGYRVKRG